MLGILLLVLLLFLADIATLVVLGNLQGGWWVVGALLVAFVAGVAVLRFAGPVTAFRVMGRLRKGELPGKELVDALLMVLGALLLISPGLLSDLVGLGFIVPGLRSLPRGVILRWVKKRTVVVLPGAGRPPTGPPSSSEGADSDVLDVDFERRE